MDFFTVNDGPVEITIDGTVYRLPRFLNPQLKEWAASIRRRARDEAVAQISDEQDRARFLMYFPPAPVDIALVLEMAVSPEGAEYVCDAAMKAAGVPDGVRAQALANSSPMMLRTLADELVTASRTMAAMGVERDKAKSDPLKQPPSASGGSPTTSQGTTRGSDTTTPAPTPTPSPRPVTSAS